MPQDSRRSNRNRVGKVHPLFAKLYLNLDEDDAGDEEEKRRSRKKIPQKRVIRRA